MGRYRKPRPGDQVQAKGMNIPFTFWPDALASGGGITTLDPWRCLQVHIHQSSLKARQQKRALAFLEQAEDFHLAASEPRMASKPLLHYYSFLALAKAFLVVQRGIDLDHGVHGLSDPAANIRKRLNITSQTVRVPDAPSPKPGKINRVHVYREFVQQCGFSVPAKAKLAKVVDLLEQTVSISRVTSRTMQTPRRFFSIDSIEFRYDSTKKEVWIHFAVLRDDLAGSSNAASDLRKHTTGFEEVESDCDKSRHFESRVAITYTRSPLDSLSELVRNQWHDIWSEMIPGGYRFWVSTLPKTKRLSQLAAGYQAMFYFGSVTRYRPDDFHKLADGKHGWMVQEFINTQPLQFIYFLGSGMIGTELAAPLLGAR